MLTKQMVPIESSFFTTISSCRKKTNKIIGYIYTAKTKTNNQSKYKMNHNVYIYINKVTCF